MSTLEVGFAKTDITPETERQTIYHRSGELDDDKTPIHDRLFARATAFRSGGRAAVWVTLDLLCVSGDLRRAVTAKLAQHGIAAENVTLCATHTHTSPTVVRFHGVDPTPERYLKSLGSAVVNTALEALSSAKPARVSFGKASVDLNVNRREIGYIPTAARFSEGGYEVDVAPYYYGLFQLSPECERIMVDAGLSVVRSVL